MFLILINKASYNVADKVQQHFSLHENRNGYSKKMHNQT
jgi:hypothetical protein